MKLLKRWQLTVTEIVFHLWVSIFAATCILPQTGQLQDSPGWEWLAMLNLWLLRPDPMTHPFQAAAYTGGMTFAFLTTGQIVRMRLTAGIDDSRT